MWGYQPTFRRLYESLMSDVMKELGISEPAVECLLVGAKSLGCLNPNSVCVEPEDGKWNIDSFDGLLDLFEKEVARHPLQTAVIMSGFRRPAPDRSCA